MISRRVLEQYVQLRSALSTQQTRPILAALAAICEGLRAIPGKKTLVMAGVWTNVCVMFPALDAKAAGFKVYAAMDASGDPSEMASRTTLARFMQAGVIPTSANAVICEVHRTWNRPDAAEPTELYTMVSPNNRAVMESYK